MIQNKIHKVPSTEADRLVEAHGEDSSTYVVALQGKDIQSWNDYISVISEKFLFPHSDTQENMNGYNDWMRDLDWLEMDGYILIIYDYDKFLSQDPQLKKKIIDGFEKYILPWWKAEVEEHVVGGVAKPFNVYLVD